MPTSRSSKKRMKQNVVHRDRNRARRSRVKTQIRKFLDAVRADDVPTATEEMKKTTRLLDRTAAKGTLHPNAVSRKKSRLAARLNAIQAK